MKKLTAPKGLVINFAPSERQMEVWNTIQPNRCDKCGGELTMTQTGFDSHGNPIHEPTCKCCGNTDIPENVLMGGAAGGGKALSLNDLVLTPNGFKRMGDIKIGDIVNTANGNYAHVIAVHPQGKKQLWKITTNDGISVKCCDDHIWKIGDTYGETRLSTMREIRKYFEDGYTIELPFCSVQPQSTQYGSFIHPYILGVLLGDGGTTKNITLTTPDQFIVDKVRSLLPEDVILKKIKSANLGYLFYNKKTDNHGHPYSPFKNEIIRLGMACKSLEKRIPKCIMNGDVEIRLACIQGLMDTDGYVDKRGHCSFSVCSKGLAEDFAYLIRSFGAKAKITSIIKHCVYKGEVKYRKAYTVWIFSQNKNIFVTLPKKKNRIPNRTFNIAPRIIESIEDAGFEEAQCITIDDPSGMFVTNGFLPTHNSYLGSAWLISCCIRYPEILMVVARLTLKDLRATTWATILRILDLWGFNEDENYRINNQYGYLDFWNGSRIMMVELSPSLKDPDYNNLGSLEITGAFIDEVSEVPEKAVEVLGSRIRYRVADTFVVGKLVMSTNPVQNYIKTRFVSDDDGNPVHLAKGDRYLMFTVFDNPDEKFRIIYFNKLRKIKDPITRNRLAYGNWDYSETNKMSAYWNFNGEKHLVFGLFRKAYDPSKPIILSFDFNVKPYMSCEVFQFDYDKKVVYVIKEFIGYPEKKLNNTPAFSRYIAKELMSWGHYGGIIVTGDPAGAARSTQTEDGVNNYTIAAKNLATKLLKPDVSLLAKQPAQVQRLEFINEVFNNFDGWKVEIELTCRKLTMDFLYQKKNEDGTKEKLKVVDPNGGKSEKYGHCSDCFDYAMVKFLGDSYGKFQTEDEIPDVTTISDGEIVYNAFDY